MEQSAVLIVTGLIVDLHRIADALELIATKGIRTREMSQP